MTRYSILFFRFFVCLCVCLVIEFRGVWRHDNDKIADKLYLSSVQCLKDIWSIYACLVRSFLDFCCYLLSSRWLCHIMDFVVMCKCLCLLLLLRFQCYLCFWYSLCCYSIHCMTMRIDGMVSFAIVQCV